jgi:lysylphosphatidylglycerol synthetase-like protein (DUF2156 family)
MEDQKNLARLSKNWQIWILAFAFVVSILVVVVNIFSGTTSNLLGILYWVIFAAFIGYVLNSTARRKHLNKAVKITALALACLISAGGIVGLWFVLYAVFSSS